jgi:ATP-dependent Clp protease ATP-binding subunit ClpC
MSEEILRGTFDGQNVIRVTVKEVGDQKQLNFEGAHEEEPTEQLAAAGEEK